jgi:hypothetical protein
LGLDISDDCKQKLRDMGYMLSEEVEEISEHYEEKKK